MTATPLARSGLALVASALMALALPAHGEEPDVVSAASPAWAHAYGERPFDAQTWRDAMQHWSAELGLFVEQQAVIADIVRDYGPKMREQIERGLAAGWSVMDVAPRDPEYTIDTQAASQEAAAAAAELIRLASEMRSAVHSILTAEQIARLDELLEEHRERARAAHDQQSAQASDSPDP